MLHSKGTVLVEHLNWRNRPFLVFLGGLQQEELETIFRRLQALPIEMNLAKSGIKRKRR